MKRFNAWVSVALVTALGCGGAKNETPKDPVPPPKAPWSQGHPPGGNLKAGGAGGAKEKP